MRKTQIPTRNGIRSLANLEATASTARVLNLITVERDWSETAEYHIAPLFKSRQLNTSLIMKHRLRRDEAYMVTTPGHITTKIVLPLHRDQFGLGGRSLLIGQRGWRDSLLDICGGEEGADFLRDLKIIELLNQLPSLDPFLLREHLRRSKIDVAPCYFAISPADIDRMRAYVAGEVTELITLAFGDLHVADAEQTSKLVSTLLSSRMDAKLDPLRRTFGMDPESFREGVFSWKGFLYYKWAMADLRDRVSRTLEELASLTIIQPCPSDSKDYIRKARSRLRLSIARTFTQVSGAIGVYDDAFRDLTGNGEPRAFREFLVRAPAMFLSLGEMIGALSHIASFWRFRFPEGAPLEATGHEAHDLLRDFETSLGIELKTQIQAA